MTSATGSAPGLVDRLAARITRRGIAKRGGLIASGALLRTLAPIGLAAQKRAPAADVLNALITLEAFTVTFYGVARGKGSALPLADDIKAFVRAAQCEEDAHFHYFEAAGAVPSTTSFTIAQKTLASQKAFLAALLPVESLLVGAYLAAARAFSDAASGQFVEIAYQIGAVEAQHQALVKLYLGDHLPSDRAYTGWMFRHPAEAVTALAQMGYIGGDGKAVDYPGPVDRYCRGLTGLVPETTEDQPPATPAAGTPAATPVGVAG
jgi:hypothetical protein